MQRDRTERKKLRDSPGRESVLGVPQKVLNLVESTSHEQNLSSHQVSESVDEGVLLVAVEPHTVRSKNKQPDIPLTVAIRILFPPDNIRILIIRIQNRPDKIHPSDIRILHKRLRTDWWEMQLDKESITNVHCY